MPLKLKRVYDPPAADDGCRVLVDRLWPRGVSKERAALDTWLKDVAPSPELRTWFGHKPERFEEFAARYQAELEQNPAVVQELRQLKQTSRVLLMSGYNDIAHQSHQSPFDRILPKPITPEQLARRVRAVLDEGLQTAEG